MTNHTQYLSELAYVSYMSRLNPLGASPDSVKCLLDEFRTSVPPDVAAAYQAAMESIVAHWYLSRCVMPTEATGLDRAKTMIAHFANVLANAHDVTALAEMLDQRTVLDVIRMHVLEHIQQRLPQTVLQAIAVQQSKTKELISMLSVHDSDDACLLAKVANLHYLRHVGHEALGVKRSLLAQVEDCVGKPDGVIIALHQKLLGRLPEGIRDTLCHEAGWTSVAINVLSSTYQRCMHTRLHEPAALLDILYSVVEEHFANTGVWSILSMAVAVINHVSLLCLPESIQDAIVNLKLLRQQQGDANDMRDPLTGLRQRWTNN